MNRTFDLLDQLQKAIQGEPDKPPKHMKTRAQWAKEWGKSDVHTGKLLREGLKRGLLIMRKYRVVTGDTIRPVPHYGPKS